MKVLISASHLGFAQAQSLTPAPEWVVKCKPLVAETNSPCLQPSASTGLFAALAHTVHVLISQAPLCTGPLGTDLAFLVSSAMHIKQLCLSQCHRLL